MIIRILYKDFIFAIDVKHSVVLYMAMGAECGKPTSIYRGLTRSQTHNEMI